MSKATMNNETEFIFDETLTEGFTVVPNNIFAYEMSDGAIGLYSRILRVKNIPGWKIYQSTLQNKSNGESKIRTAINELIAYGFIEKITLRENGKISGIKYMVYSSSQKTDEEIKISLQEIENKKRKNKNVIQREEQRDSKNQDNVEGVGNTDFPPKREKPVLEKQEREKQGLKKKDPQKIKNLKNKDKTTTNGKSENKDIKKIESKNSSSNKIKINLDLKNITKTNIKKLKLNQEQIELLEEYVLNSECDDLDGFSYFIAKSIKNGEITRDSLKSKSHKINKQVSSNNDVTLFRETREKQLESYNNAIEDDFDNLTL